MDLRKLKKLIELVEESGIAELEITEGEEKVRISKSVIFYADSDRSTGTPACSRQHSLPTYRSCAVAPQAAQRQPNIAGRPCGEVADGRYLLP